MPSLWGQALRQGLVPASLHVTGTGFEKDAEKFSCAAILGYRVLHITAKHIESGQAIEWLKAALDKEVASG